MVGDTTTPGSYGKRCSVCRPHLRGEEVIEEIEHALTKWSRYGVDMPRAVRLELCKVLQHPVLVDIWKKLRCKQVVVSTTLFCAVAQPASHHQPYEYCVTAATGIQTNVCIQQPFPCLGH